MYIKLTNSHPDYMDEPIVLNTANIVAVYTQQVAPSLTVTCIHCPPHGTWNVRESVEEVCSVLDVKTVKTALTSVNTAKSNILDITPTAKQDKKNPKPTV